MTTNLERAKRNRIKVVEYYTNAWQFIIRLLMGLGIYIVLRIALMAYLTQVQGLAFTFCDSLAELSVLIVTALLTVSFIWFKGSRSHLAASVWMPAVACLAISDLIHFVMILSGPSSMDAWMGIVPFLMPLIMMILYWIFDPENIWLKLLFTVIFLAMTAFWITDIPKSFNEADNVQTLVQDYQKFSEALREQHLLAWEQVPESLESGEVLSLWHTKPVDPLNYRIDREIRNIDKMFYVEETDIIINALDGGAKVSSQELSFNTLDHVSLHYFFKYSTTRKIVLKDFQYTGDAFFLLELESGEKIVVDNVLIRKKQKENTET